PPARARGPARDRRNAPGHRRGLRAAPDLSASADDLRALLRAVPSGVAVLTVDVDGERLGLTVSSFLGLSLDPPLVGVSVNRQAAMHELLRRSGRFALSL